MGDFFESEIIFSDSDYDSDTNRQLDTLSNHEVYAAPHRRTALTVNRSRRSGTAPMEIPTGNFSSSGQSSPTSAMAFQRGSDVNIFAVDEWLGGDEEDDMMVPPHMIVARRINLESSRSGSGGLKGRNLNRVRNSILRMTGFLEQ